MSKFCFTGRSTLALAIIGLTVSTAQAQLTKQSVEPEPVAPTLLRFTPMPAPEAVFQYRLFPLDSERTPGDAAPIYIRLGLQLVPEATEQHDGKGRELLDVPLAEFSTEEAREFLRIWDKRIEQIRFGSMREDCDWSYTLQEQRREAIEILLPDLGEMRRWDHVLAVQARRQIVEHEYDNAIDTIRVGMAFGEHVARVPFLIGDLVGVAIQNLMLDRVEELIASPAAPNLYWALTALPDPPISFREGFETEQKVAEWLVPELTNLEALRTPADWDSQLDRLLTRSANPDEQLERLDRDFGLGKLRSWVAAADTRAKLLPKAHAYFEGRPDPPSGMGDSETILRYIVAQFQADHDDKFRAIYLPYPQARRLVAKQPIDKQSLHLTPLNFLDDLTPSIQAGLMSKARFARRVAILRVVEAIRLHAASHDGKLPTSLDDVTEVPIPIDPYSGQPFSYTRDGDAAILATPPGDDAPGHDQSYRLEIANE